MKTIADKHKTGFVLVLLAIVTLSIYWQVRNYDFVNYDDNVYVTDNPDIKSGLTLQSIRWAFATPVARNWHPLTLLSLTLDYQLFGQNPGAFHMTNVVIHIASALLLFLLLKAMTGCMWRSAFVAALFALHPLHVESVAWISERKDVLSTFFWILTMAAYLRYTRKPGLKRYILLLLTFVLGLLSKAMLVTLPFTLLLLDYWPLKRLQFTRGKLMGLIKEKLPLFILSAVFCVITFMAQRVGGTMRSLETIPINARIANALISYVKYIQKMFVPAELAALYPHPGGRLPISEAAIAGLILIVISVLVIRYAKRLPYLAFGWLWYIGTLVPVIGIVQVGAQAMADRYTYVPLTGIFVIIAWALPDILSRWRYRNIVLAPAGALIIAALTALTWIQTGYWQNSITLFERTLAVTRNNYTAHNNLATALDEAGRSSEAIEHYQKTLKLNPNYVKARYNLGNAYQNLGKFDQAIEQWSRVLRLDPRNTGAHNNLGVVLARQGKYDQAIEHYQKVIQLAPGDTIAKNNLAKAVKKQRDKEQALGFYEQATVLAKESKFAEAIELYQKALKINPNFVMAHNNLANVYLLQKDFDRSITHYSKAIEIAPDFTEACYNLGVLLTRQGKIEQAIEQYRRTLENNPNHTKARRALQNLLESQASGKAKK